VRRTGLALVAAVLMVGCGSSSTFHLDTSVRSLKQGQVVDSVPCLTADIPEHHLHVHLAIYLDGAGVKVPAGIGVGRPWGFDSTGFLATGSCFAWLHTHDATGVIHIATPVAQAFNLGQLFQIWGQPLSSAGAFNYHGSLKVLVDGRATPGDPNALALTQYENIVLELGKPPAVAPASIYDFSGLSR